MFQVNYQSELGFPSYQQFYPRITPPPPPGIFGDAIDNGPDSSICVNLEDEDLWRSFSDAGTEMIITKMGRRMFPGLRITVSGLVPTEKYALVLDLAPCDTKRYKFTDGEWKVGGRAEPQHHRRFFIHPDSPNTGQHWSSNQISFRTAKLTNNLVNDPNMIVLNSMHKYQPRILVVKVDDLEKINFVPSFSSYTFTSTAFIAVTAYQNSQVTKLKIAHNPFAKGFRERQTVPTRKRVSDGNEPLEAKRSCFIPSLSPEPVSPPETDHFHVVNSVQESPSSGSNSTNSSFSSEHVGYHFHTGYYEMPTMTATAMPSRFRRFLGFDKNFI